MIRDKYSGDYMARVMSFVTVVFILVPIIAPAMGKWILDFYGWEAIFHVQVLFGILVSIWFWKRRPETLVPQKRTRDKYSGDYMARVMSFVTVVFILVPIIAPAMGKWILDFYGWEAIFHVQVLFGILVSIWFWKRQPETLVPQKRTSFRANVFINGYRELLNYRQTMLFTIIWGFITGSFLVYLSTSQQIFQEQYDLKKPSLTFLQPWPLLLARRHYLTAPWYCVMGC